MWVLQLGSGQFLNLTHGKFPNLWSSQVRVLGFSADSSQVTMMTGAEGLPTGTSIVSTIGGPIRRFLDNGLDPQWSLDGSRLVYFSILQNRDVMYMADRDGTNPRQVFTANAGEHNHFMGWYPSGRYVYLCPHHTKRSGIGYMAGAGRGWRAGAHHAPQRLDGLSDAAR